MTRIGLAIASIGMAAALTACGGGDDFTDQSGEEIADAVEGGDEGPRRGQGLRQRSRPSGQEIDDRHPDQRRR